MIGGQGNVNDGRDHLETDGLRDVPDLFDPSDLSLDIDLSELETSHATQQGVRASNSIVLRAFVMIIGDPAVGKSALIKVFAGQVYPKNYVMNTGVNLCVTSVPIPNTEVTVDLFCHDMPGQSVFNQHEMARLCNARSSFIICVFDVSSRKSLQNCTDWVQSVRSTAMTVDTKEIPVLLVGNKTDLRDGLDSRSEVDTDEALQFAQEHGFEYFDCSPCLGRDVDRPFNYIASQSLKRHSKDCEE